MKEKRSKKRTKKKEKSETELEEQVINKEVSETIEESKNIELQEETIELETNIEEGYSSEADNELDDYEFYKPTITSSTYNETVDNLINEVKLFHGEGELEEQPKKSKKFLIVSIIILLITVSTVLIFILINKRDNDNSKDREIQEETHEYIYKEQKGKIEFYEDNVLIDTYICMDEKCNVYSVGMYEYFSVNPKVIAIFDDNSIFLYNYIEKKAISSHYASLQNLYKKDETVAFIAYNNDNLVGIIGVDGNVVVPFEYDAIGYSINSGYVSDYSYNSNNLITAMKDDKWGLISLIDGNIILEFKYDDIYYNGYDCIAVKENDSWYLLNLQGEKILNYSYDIIIPSKSYIFVSANGIFSILNYKGANIINKEIPTYIKGFRDRKTSIIPTFKIDTNGTVITIYIMKDSINYIEYKFNTVNGELTEVIR